MLPNKESVVFLGTNFDVSFARSYLAGLTLSNDGTSPNTVLGIAAGICVDSTNSYFIRLPTFSKSTGGSFTPGNGNNGMGTGLTIANSTWYHVFVIVINGLPDVYFDTSVTAANRPGGTNTPFRRIGSFKTNGAAAILSFTQLGDEFIWATQVTDVSATTVSTTGTTFTLASVPTGLKINALFWATLTATPAAWNGSIFSPDLTTVVGFNFNGIAGAAASQALNVRTNTSAQVSATISSSGGNANIWTYGWVDTRGKLT